MNDLEETLYRVIRAATHHGAPYVEIPEEVMARLNVPEPSPDRPSRADIVAAVSGSFEPGMIASDIPLVCGAAERNEARLTEKWCLWYPDHPSTHGWEDPTPPPGFE